MRVRSALIGVGLTVLAISVLAQAPNDKLTFEVASVKPSSGSERPNVSVQPGGRFVATATSLRSVLAFAFGGPGLRTLRNDQIVDLPEWGATDQWDIIAEAADERGVPVGGALTSPEIRLRLQHLLADRFHLVAHMGARERPVFALVAKNAGRLGPDIHPSSADCATAACGNAPNAQCPRQTCLREIGVSMDQLAYDVRGQPNTGIDRPVLNRTGLDGRYDVLLRWVPPTSSAARAAGVPDVAPNEEVSFFTAIQDHLGLKLEATTGPVDTLVIDHVERPAGD